MEGKIIEGGIGFNVIIQKPSKARGTWKVRIERGKIFNITIVIKIYSECIIIELTF